MLSPSAPQKESKEDHSRTAQAAKKPGIHRMTHHQPQAKAKTAPPLKLFLPAHKKHPLLISMQRGTVIYSKSLAEFATSVANKVKYILRQGVYLTQNTSQAASVRVVRLWRTRSARGGLQKTWLETPTGVSSQASTPCLFLCRGCVIVNRQDKLCEPHPSLPAPGRCR